MDSLRHRVTELTMLLSAVAASHFLVTEVAAKPAVGKELLQTHCSRCHAIDKTDMSRQRDAPPLRNIYRQYSTERLEFELSEGIGSRHRKMPQIQFSTEQIDSIIKYLKSLSNTN